MTAATLHLDSTVLETFPALQVRALAVSGLANVPERDAAPWFADAEARLERDGVTADTLSRDPRIARWREAMREQGLKPSDIRSSAEALARRVLRGTRPATGIPLVDVANAASVGCLAPIGAYDAARLPAATVTVRMARPAEDQFDPIGGPSSKMVMRETVAVYASGATVLCWAFNHRDSAQTAVDATTDAAIVFAESLDAAHHDAAEQAMDLIAGWLPSAGARVGPIRAADAANPTVAVEHPDRSAEP